MAGNYYKTKTRGIIGAVLLSGLLFCVSCTGPAVSTGFDKQPVTLILGAFNAEVAPIQKELVEKQRGLIEGIDFVKGKLRDRIVVVTWTGVGKINAAMTTTLFIEHFHPNEVIVCGIAGAINPQLSVGDVVIAEKSLQHDYGRWTDASIERSGTINRLTEKRNPKFFTADERLLDVAGRAGDQTSLKIITIEGKERPTKVIKGVVVTGDTFIMSPQKKAELRNRLGADAVEMEGAAIAQICYQRGISHIVIRGISDTADEKAVQDMGIFQNIAIENAAAVVCKMAELIKTQSQTGKKE